MGLKEEVKIREINYQCFHRIFFQWQLTSLSKMSLLYHSGHAFSLVFFGEHSVRASQTHTSIWNSICQFYVVLCVMWTAPLARK